MENAVKAPGKRRHGRELAVQCLYQVDLTGDASEEALAGFWETQEDVPPATRRFAEELIRGVLEQRAVLDEKISRYAEHWDLERIAVVDRNILRLAIYEMMFRNDIPPVVSINEAIEIAKKYSTRESGAFVNGILDRIKFDLPRPARTASPS
ncbi:MAG: transcription antitermination factor NusB [Verrucomicrobiae bacterium]|nr:transcription antitermination factor NusB [Verrucomicrobiae bacterium]MDW8344852.1 transcription antitermination factor NusB [Verrucomicrobiae bacterium]